MLVCCVLCAVYHEYSRSLYAYVPGVVSMCKCARKNKNYSRRKLNTKEAAKEYVNRQRLTAQKAQAERRRIKKSKNHSVFIKVFF